MTVQDGFSKDLELRIPLTASAGSTAIFDGTNWKVLSQGIPDKVASATKADSATTADKLKTSRKISLTTGVTAAGYFDGNSDLSLKVTNLANDYMNWSPYDLVAKQSSILDDALLSETTNVFGFFPADCIDIEYSVDGGTTWLDYGVANWYKRGFVTPEATNYISQYQIRIGQDILPTTTQQKVRITLSADKGNERILYCMLRKLKFKFSSNGAAGCTVKFFKENYANRDTWIQQNSSTVTGWPAWYTMNCNLAFGSNSSTPGSYSSAYNYSRIRLEFSIQGLTSQSTATTANKFTIYCLYGLSDNIYYFNNNYIDSCWINNHKPYRLDINKNAYFFGNISGNLMGKATKAEQDSEGNVIKDTYLKKSELPDNSTLNFENSINSPKPTTDELIYINTNRNGTYSYYRNQDNTRIYSVSKNTDGTTTTTQLFFKLNGNDIYRIQNIDINEDGECLIFTCYPTSSTISDYFNFIRYTISGSTTVYKETITRDFSSLEGYEKIGISNSGFFFIKKNYILQYLFDTSSWRQLTHGDSNNKHIKIAISQDRNKAVLVYDESSGNSDVFSRINRDFYFKIATLGSNTATSFNYSIIGGAEIQELQIANNGNILVIHGANDNAGEYPYRMYIYSAQGNEILSNFYNGERFILRSNDTNLTYLLTQEKPYYPEWYISELTQGDLYTERKLQKIQDFKVLDNENIQLLTI